MTQRLDSDADFDRAMRQWMDDGARGRAPEHLLDSVLDETRHTRRIPGWLLPERWISMQLALRAPTMPRLVPLLLLVAALLIAAALAVVLVGAPRRLPPPFGPAANGLIAYDTNAEIFVANADGTNSRSLVSTLSDTASATFSPDGTRLAFWAYDSPDSLFVVNADGTGLMQIRHDLWIATDRPPAWSPDGRSIVYSTESGPDRMDEALFIVSADGHGTPVRIAGGLPIRASFPSWSPDGQWIAYLSEPTGGAPGSVIRIVRPNGDDDHEVGVGTFVDEAQPQWRPVADSHEIVFSTKDLTDLYVVDTATNKETQITDDADRDKLPGWSPDGRRLAWLVGNATTAIRIADADGLHVRTIPSTDPSEQVEWSPDGTKIYSTDGEHRRMTVVTIDGSSPHVVISHAAGQGMPTWQRVAP
jgi:Tol biopolymer transport system component